MPRMMCPAYMLAKRRTASVKMRRNAEKTSMTQTIRLIGNGTPWGAKLLM